MAVRNASPTEEDLTRLKWFHFPDLVTWRTHLSWSTMTKICMKSKWVQERMRFVTESDRVAELQWETGREGSLNQSLAAPQQVIKYKFWLSSTMYSHSLELYISVWWRRTVFTVATSWNLSANMSGGRKKNKYSASLICFYFLNILVSPIVPFLGFFSVARLTLLSGERRKKYCMSTEDCQGHLWQWINNHIFRKINPQAGSDS